MENGTIREQLEAYAKEKYKVEAEQLPFNREDYAIFRHTGSGKWFAVFIVKPRSEFGLDGDGDAEIASLKTRDPLLADMLMQQPGYLRGYPSKKKKRRWPFSGPRCRPHQPQISSHGSFMS